MTRAQIYTILIIAILILAAGNYIAFTGWSKSKANADRMSLNYAAANQVASNRVIQEQLSRAEFHRFYEAKIDSLKQLGLKRVDGVTSVKIRKVYSDRMVWRDSIVHDTIPIPVRVVAASDSCLNLNVTDMGDSVQVDAVIAIQAEVVYLRGERSKRFWFVRYGRRVPTVHVLSNCGQVHVRSVTVVD
jgi:hypothetical protein